MIKEYNNEANMQRLIGRYLAEMESAKNGADELNIKIEESELYLEAQQILKAILDIAKHGGFSFSTALFLLKQGFKVSRAKWGWKGTNVYIQLQIPDENSKMSEPYVFMHKKMFDDNKDLIGEKKFPTPLSDESIFANDWFLAEE